MNVRHLRLVAVAASVASMLFISAGSASSAGTQGTKPSPKWYAAAADSSNWEVGSSTNEFKQISVAQYEKQTGRSAVADAPAASTGVEEAVAATSCYSWYHVQVWTVLKVTVARSWQTVNWCGDSSRITSASIGSPGGAGAQLGISWRGAKGPWTMYTSTKREYRAMYTHTFDFAYGPAVSLVDRCHQQRVTFNNVRWNYAGNCNLN